MKTVPIPPEISLASIRAANTPRVHPCSLADFVRGLKPAEMQAVYQAMGDRAIASSAIHRVLTERGWHHDVQVIWRHRHKGCPRCEALGFKVP